MAKNAKSAAGLSQLQQLKIAKFYMTAAAVAVAARGCIDDLSGLELESCRLSR